MMRRLLVPFLFVTCGFVGGMVLTGRLHTAEEARAEPRQTGGQPLTSPVAAGTLPDLSAVAARTIPSVMNIASLQIVRSQNTPFASDPLFRYFFGDQMAPPAQPRRAEPGLRRDRLGRRLHPHQQPRRRRRQQRRSRW